MQKKIIALAIAAGMSSAAFAQSNVTISGLFRMSAEQYKLHDVGAGFEASAENRVSDQSSMLVFRGVEQLGNGMSASFQIDNRFSGDLGAFAASGNTHIKLGGSWGSVAMGRQDLHYGTAIESYKAYTLQNILSNGIFAQVNGQNVAYTTRTANAVWYDSPDMNGFTVRLAMSSNGAANEGTGLRAAGLADPSKGSDNNIALNYANGPITAGYSYWRHTNEGGKGATAATADQRGDTLQGSYTFPMGVKVGLGWNRSRLDMTVAGAGVEASRTAWILPVSYSWGNHQAAFTYAKAGNTTNVVNSGAKAFTLAYGYSLSKRTNAGVSYTKLTNDAGGMYNLFAIAANGGTTTAANAGADVSQMAVNVNHAF